MPNISQPGPAPQNPFMQNNFPGMPGGFNPGMVPPGANFPGQTPMQTGEPTGAAPVQQQQQPITPSPAGGDASVVAHKLPSSQVR